MLLSSVYRLVLQICKISTELRHYNWWLTLQLGSVGIFSTYVLLYALVAVDGGQQPDPSWQWLLSCSEILVGWAWFIHQICWFPNLSSTAGLCTVLNVLFHREQALLAQGNHCPKIQMGSTFQGSSLQVLFCWNEPAPCSATELSWRKPSKSTPCCRAVQGLSCSARDLQTPFHSWNCETHFILSWNACMGRLIRCLYVHTFILDARQLTQSSSIPCAVVVFRWMGYFVVMLVMTASHNQNNMLIPWVVCMCKLYFQGRTCSAGQQWEQARSGQGEDRGCVYVYVHRNLIKTTWGLPRFGTDFISRV